MIRTSRCFEMRGEGAVKFVIPEKIGDTYVDPMTVELMADGRHLLVEVAASSENLDYAILMFEEALKYLKERKEHLARR